MHTELDARYWILDTRRTMDENRASPSTAGSRSNPPSAGENRVHGFTLTELVVVLLIFSLFVLLAQENLFGLLGKNTFSSQAQELVSTMQMAASAAGQSDRRYEVIIDLTEQNFLLRQITTPDLSEVLEEEIITENTFSDNCRLVYVQFDDGEYTNEGKAKFRVGHSGWQYGGKIVLLDSKERTYSVVVNRLNRIITLREGDVGLLEPKAKDEMPF
jgi:prepilin-type N-terminal cleavage/methylation domain-containing protein